MLKTVALSGVSYCILAEQYLKPSCEVYVKKSTFCYRLEAGLFHKMRQTVTFNGRVMTEN